MVTPLPFLQGALIVDQQHGSGALTGRWLKMNSFKNKTKNELIDQLKNLQKQFKLVSRKRASGTEKSPALHEGADEFWAILDSIEDGYWEVDLQGNLTYCTNTLARIMGYSQKELIGINYSQFMDGKTAKAVFNHYNKVYRTGIPVKTGAFEVTRKDGTKLVVDISVSLILSDEGKPCGFRGITRDITEQQKARQLHESFEMMRKTFGQTINALSVAFELRDPYTAGHHLRVSDLSRSIAVELGMSGDEIDGIRIAGSIHDIGKISIPSEILNKPGILTEYELTLVKTHSEMGYNILKNVDFPWPVAQAVYQHHELIDGSGYPLGLAGDDIIIEAKIISVANRIDAMASHRPYRKAIDIHAALEEIWKKKGLLYDPDVVDACLHLFEKKSYVLKK
jgi:PAS domain S-box-containing protein